MQTIKLELTIEQLNLIMGCLGKQPFEVVFQVVEEIQKQARAQAQVPAQTPAEAPKPPAM